MAKVAVADESAVLSEEESEGRQVSKVDVAAPDVVTLHFNSKRQSLRNCRCDMHIWHITGDIGCHEMNVVFHRTSRLIDVQVRNQYGVQIIAVGLVGNVGKL